MKSGAPGTYDCEVFLKAWQLDVRDDFVMRHIDSCPWCGPVIHGDGDLFQGSIEDEARTRLADRRRSRRRRFLKIVAAGVVGVTVAGFGFAGLESFGPRNRNYVEQHAQTWAGSMDQLYALGGAQGVRLAMATMTPNELERTMEWVVHTERAPLYGDLVGLLGTTNVSMKRKSLAWLYQLPPIDLQPELANLESTLDSETDPAMRQALGGLVQRVRHP